MKDKEIIIFKESENGDLKCLMKGSMSLRHMMIDYRREDGEGFERKQIDGMEFCVRNGMMYFISEGKKYSIPLDQCSQVYMT